MEVTANPLYMWFVGIALFAGILCAYCLQRKRRREQFYRMADEIGFKSNPNIYSLPADYRCDRRDFPLDHYGKLFNGIQSMVLYGTVNNADVLMFDYADYEEATQTVACFHVDRELVWASFPDKPDSVQGRISFWA